MKINSTLEKKLLKYSALAAGTIAISSNADAQLGYTDFNPDVALTGNGSTQNIDFDGDTNVDLLVGTQVGSFTGTTSGIAYTVFYNAGVVVTAPGNTINTASSNPAALAVTTPINASGVFGGFDSGGTLGFGASYTFPAYPGYSGTFNGGAWIGAVDMYLGARFMIGAATHYGWVRMDLTADGATLTVKDMAYNMVADGPINAGATGIGVGEISEDLALVRFFNNRLDVKVVDGTNGNLSVINMEGKVVYTGSLNNAMESIDLSSMAAGLYVVNAEFTEGSVQHKIVVR